MLDVGSLFSGIGGFDLGLERAGMRVKWQCEQDDYCQRVLAKHWPGVPRFPDITELRGSDVEHVDVLCGGFPCQDLSVAGRGAGLDGARSGLWSEFARLIGELRPRYVVVENVPMLRSRGLGRILGEMAALGYDAEWDCIPASAIGAPHRRDRIWLVAYPQGIDGWPGEGSTSEAFIGGEAVGEPTNSGQHGRAGVVGHPDCTPENTYSTSRTSRNPASESGWWTVEPDVGRVAHGVPARVDRLRALGNALIPQIAEWIGRRIIDYEETHDH